MEIPANDSIYVFVAVTVDPNIENNPFVMYDSVLFETNGNLQSVTLQAWGQNANFIYGEVIGTQTWTPEKPYVIIHSILVDSNQGKPGRPAGRPEIKRQTRQLSGCGRAVLVCAGVRRQGAADCERGRSSAGMRRADR